MSADERPSQLQVNLNGAWKTVLHFDAGDDQASDLAQRGAMTLHAAAPNTHWRIATRDSYPIVLRHLGTDTDGEWKENLPPG